jgi:nucleotide-binding universal stress UspA family protein
MEHLLIALDGSEGSLRVIDYVVRVLRGAEHVRITLFHILPAASPDTLTPLEVRRIEGLHETRADLSGYFWSRDTEELMEQTFQRARERLVAGGFESRRIATRHAVQSATLAQVILDQAVALGCSTVVLGRRGLGRVRGFFSGSVSRAVASMAGQTSVWVVGERSG